MFVVVLSAFMFPFIEIKEGALAFKSHVPYPYIEQVEIPKPLNIKTLPNFATIRDVKEKKRAFFNFLKPMVKRQNLITKDTRQKLKILKYKLSSGVQLRQFEIDKFYEIAKTYKVKKPKPTLEYVEQLLRRVDVIPQEIVLMQAANESAWGTSRFAKQGLNLFGQWCYRPGCGIVPTGRPDDKTYEVAKYNTIDESVRRYFINLNTNMAYKGLRDKRAELRAANEKLKATELVKGLTSYSSRGNAYVEEITQMIRTNKSYLVN
ncbi:glucosaminidase domain-containing protein [Flocculibacter collagenilyticus]|uniref:glucosaminidase domain-containing protein n=1 Tax=Flocculibacter collagenilyticus TaxID=2744479 RepID=UPI0018F4E7E6|nr:glucosaminidase domain-containing protein [Flocculibacter collagenilyticus]